jgi:hypothetical protein
VRERDRGRSQRGSGKQLDRKQGRSHNPLPARTVGWRRDRRHGQLRRGHTGALPAGGSGGQTTARRSADWASYLHRQEEGIEA